MITWYRLFHCRFDEATSVLAGVLATSQWCALCLSLSVGGNTCSDLCFWCSCFGRWLLSHYFTLWQQVHVWLFARLNGCFDWPLVKVLNYQEILCYIMWHHDQLTAYHIFTAEIMKNGSPNPCLSFLLLSSSLIGTESGSFLGRNCTFLAFVAISTTWSITRISSSLKTLNLSLKWGDNELVAKLMCMHEQQVAFMLMH